MVTFFLFVTFFDFFFILAEHKLRRAQLYGDSKMVQQAQQTPRPNCKRLDDIQNNAAAGGWVFFDLYYVSG